MLLVLKNVVAIQKLNKQVSRLNFDRKYFATLMKRQILMIKSMCPSHFRFTTQHSRQILF